MTKKSNKGRARKTGLPPGALVHIGEVKTAEPRLSAIHYAGERFGEFTLDSPAQIDRLPTDGVRWINVYGLQNPELIAAIGRRFGLHPLLVEDVLNTDQRPKIDEYRDHIFIVAHVYERSQQAFQRDQVSLVLGRNFVLTFQERSTGTFEAIRQRLRSPDAGLRSRQADDLAYALLDSLVDRQFALIETITDEAEKLEELILSARRPKAAHFARTLADIHRLKRDVSYLRRAFSPLREVLHVLQRNPGNLFDQETLWYLRDVYDHTIHVVESLEGLREMLSGLLDVYFSAISNRVNQEVRLLTVITTVFMPLSLIAGIFGMNFHRMPWVDNADGFTTTIGLMAVVALAMLLMFWRRRML
jgi:magnesium transporter